MVAVVVAADSHQGAAASCYYQPSCGIMLLLVAAALFFGLPVVSALVASRHGPNFLGLGGSNNSSRDCFCDLD